jgi:Zn-dependent protease
MLITLITMVVTGYVYALIFGYPFGVGFILSIFLHEAGHAIAAHFMGLKVKTMAFLPGLAFVELKNQPRTTIADSVISIGGPLAGGIGGAGALIAGLHYTTGYWSELLIVLAWATLTINLFNMVPLGPLDGRHISRHFKPWFWIPGCVLMGVLVYYTRDASGTIHPLPMYILLLGVMYGVVGICHRCFHTKRLVDRLKPKPRYAWDDATTRPWQRKAMALAYFGLAAALLLLSVYAAEHRPALDPQLVKIRAAKFF